MSRGSDKRFDHDASGFPLPSAANIMVTGGAGFIGSNFIRHVLSRPDFTGTVVNYDKLTYAGNLLSLSDIADRHIGKRYFFERGDICDYGNVMKVLSKYGITVIVHFAAESHVDRSIFGPKDFIETNISGTFNILRANAGRREKMSGFITSAPTKSTVPSGKPDLSSNRPLTTRTALTLHRRRLRTIW
jgi:dTDP-glucose 4,6-dehydratase